MSLVWHRRSYRNEVRADLAIGLVAIAAASTKSYQTVVDTDGGLARHKYTESSAAAWRQQESRAVVIDLNPVSIGILDVDLSIPVESFANLVDIPRPIIIRDRPVLHVG